MGNGEVIVILCRQKINHQFKSIGKEMSPFLIFAIVLTIGYVLYYAAHHNGFECQAQVWCKCRGKYCRW